MTRRTRLREILAHQRMAYAPGVYDCLSARLVEQAGFDVAYMTGAGTAASLIGKPDLGLMTLTEMASHAARIAETITIPLVADADTGYGNAINVYRTVKEYERAGVAALHIEDQVFPKRCGHLSGKRVLPTNEFVGKLHAAVDARNDPGLVIIARTDARAALGLDEAIERANRYAEAGADAIFIDAPESLAEVERIPKEIQAPAIFDLVAHGRTPPVTSASLRGFGYAMAIVPGICLDAAIVAVRRSLSEARVSDDFATLQTTSPTDHFSIVELEVWDELGRRYDPVEA